MKFIHDYARSRLEDELSNSFVTDGRSNVIEFWCSLLITSKFPKLCKLAKGILSVPASSAPSERAFSLSRNVLTKNELNYRQPL